MNNYTKEISALVSLLDDPDAKVSTPVIDRLIEIGTPAVRLLENYWENTLDLSLQTKIENVILNIQQTKLRKDVKDWVDCRGEQLMYGATLLARSKYPGLSYNTIDVKIGDIIITSGYSQIFPENIKIGVVIDVVRDIKDLFQEVTVQPSVDFNQLEEAHIVKMIRGESDAS